MYDPSEDRVEHPSRHILAGLIDVLFGEVYVRTLGYISSDRRRLSLAIFIGLIITYETAWTMDNPLVAIVVIVITSQVLFRLLISGAGIIRTRSK